MVARDQHNWPTLPLDLFDLLMFGMNTYACMQMCVQAARLVNDGWGPAQLESYLCICIPWLQSGVTTNLNMMDLKDYITNVFLI